MNYEIGISIESEENRCLFDISGFAMLFGKKISIGLGAVGVHRFEESRVVRVDSNKFESHTPETAGELFAVTKGSVVK